MDSRFWDHRMETLPAERLALLQDHRLHWQVRRCWDASTWHRARFKQAGIDPTTFLGLPDLARIPILTDGDLHAAAPSYDLASLAVAPRVWWEHTESDAVRPARVLTDGDVIQRADIAARALWAAGGRPDRMLRTGATGDAFASIERLRQRSGHEYGGVMPPFSVIVAEGQGDPGGARLELRWALPPADASGPGHGAPFVALGLPYVAPTVAYACGQETGFHWAEDHFLVEIVDRATTRPIEDSEVGAVVITELTREGTPLLRYWTGCEAAREKSACACGRTSARSPFVRLLAGQRSAI